MSQDVRERPHAGEDQPPPEPPRSPRFPPIAYPLVGLVVGGLLVWAFSRILLSVSKDAASAIAVFTALNVLVGSTLVAYGRRVRSRPASFPLLILAGLLVVAAGVVAVNVTGSGEEAPGPEAVSLTAKDITFSTDAISVRPGEPIALRFDNEDAGVQHNVAIFRGPDASAPVVFRGDLVTGVASATYQVSALQPGQYFFHCDVHPTMHGTITAGGAGPPPGGGGGEPGGPSAGAAQLSAKDIQFSTTSLDVTPEGGKVAIHFSNEDTQPHNVAVFNGSDANAPVIFRGDITQPGSTSDYSFDAPPPGTYYFHCDVHPTMHGELTVGG
jgi:plastocyanin